MSYTFVCYRNCTTCSKAKAFLDKEGIQFTYREITEETPTVQELTEWVERGTYPLKSFFNTSGQSYRKLGLKDRLPSLSQEELIEMLASDGMLIKLPILVSPDTLLIGFKPEEWKQALHDALD